MAGNFKSNAHHRVKGHDFHLDKAGRVNRRLVSVEVWDRLCDHYRQFPGDHTGAAKAADVAYGTARKAWDEGSQRANRPPIKEVIASEQVQIRGELADLRRLTTQERAVRAKQAQDDQQDDRVLAVRTLRMARANAVAAMHTSGMLLRTGLALANQLSDDIDSGPNLSAKDKMALVRAIIRMNETAVNTAALTARMERDQLGGPEVVVQVAQFTPEESLEIVSRSERTARRLRETLERDQARAIDTSAVEQPALPEPVDDLPPDQPTRHPTPRARSLDLPRSSNIRSALYDSEDRALWVTFASGAQYRYTDVPPDVVDSWESAWGAGQFFSDEIREEFDYEQID